ncbi:unnamed protein product [Rhodiola kirilowii]
MSRIPSFIFLVICVINLLPKNALSDPQVPACYFVFGDSLADPGNNNVLVTQAKANYSPYGVDFPNGKATGRFTNGKTVVDFLARLLGFIDFIPSFLFASGSQLLQGVNYASGAAGIRDESGRNQGDRITLKEQVQLHDITVNRLTIQLLNRTAAVNHLKQCIYTLGFGSNDYINNYFMPDMYTSSQRFTPEQFAKLIVSEYGAQLNKLYKNGARKVALLGVGPVGFTPYELGRYGPAGAPTLNAAVELFNEELKGLVDSLNANLTDARFTFLNTTGISSGGNITLAQLVPCCQVQQNNFTCIPFNNNICANRLLSVFFDNVHPTEVANEPVANSQPQVPCYFIFGDSLSDPGNNNNLKTQAKANYLPYGVDFPNRQATGRFTNGKTVVDFIAGLLGFPGLIPNIQSASGSQLLQGESTMPPVLLQGDRLNFAKQVELHQATVTRVSKQLGSQNAAIDHLKQCIYTVGIGSNDYINNYFMPDLYTSNKQYTPEQFAKLVADEYAAKLNATDPHVTNKNLSLKVL